MSNESELDKAQMQGREYLGLEPYSEASQMLESIENWERYFDKNHTPQNAMRIRLGFPATTTEEIADAIKTKRIIGLYVSDVKRK